MSSMYKLQDILRTPPHEIRSCVAQLWSEISTSHHMLNSFVKIGTDQVVTFALLFCCICHQVSPHKISLKNGHCLIIWACLILILTILLCLFLFKDKSNKRRMLMAIDRRKKLLKHLRLVRYDAFEKVCEQLGITYTFPPEYYRRATCRWLAKKAFCIKVFLIKNYVQTLTE